MFVPRVFALAVAALASVSFVGAAPAAGKDIDLVKRDAPATVLGVLNTLNTNLGGPTGQISTSPLSYPE